MTHWHNQPRKWQPGELEVLHKMMKSDSSPQHIQYMLPHRSIESIEGRIRWERMTDAQRQTRRDGINRRRFSMCARPAGTTIGSVASAKAPDDLLRARDERALAEPRDLTASLMGDPLPGYSALERRS